MLHLRSVLAIQTDALFASPLQRSDEHTAGELRLAIAAALDAHGDTGCAERVAQEFGDHPEIAVVRMRWARAMVAGLEGPPVLRTRRMVAAGQVPAARLPASRPAYFVA